MKYLLQIHGPDLEFIRQLLFSFGFYNLRPESADIYVEVPESRLAFVEDFVTEEGGHIVIHPSIAFLP